jgi:hypothetical protein
MLSKIIDSLCSCKNQQENEKSVIKITFPEPTTSELLKPTFSKFKISDNNDKLNSSKSNVISIVPNHLFVNYNNDNESISNSPHSQKQSLTLVKLPEEIIRNKIKMFKTCGSKKKRIDENVIFQNFQNQIDNIIKESLKQKTVSESEDSENIVSEH